MNQPLPIVDTFGRHHTSFRISVTDRCNIRCFYCMPEENVQFRPRPELLTYEEFARVVRVAADMGINRIRLTGGEPLVRRDIDVLIERLKQTPGIESVGLTTNGLLLPQHARALARAGLDRLNISLDTLDEEVFFQISRRRGLDQVIEGIHLARELGFKKIRLNAIAIKGLTESQIIPLVEFAVQSGLELRFIEFMPLDADRQWDVESVLTGAQLRRTIAQHFGPLTPEPRDDPSQPAVDYRLENFPTAVLGFIESVSRPFCETCNRIRLLADGSLRNCLFGTATWDLKAVLRNGGTDDQISAMIRDCVQQKKPGHGSDDYEFRRPDSAMYQIGG